jgi:hypothetical protein
MDISNVEKEPLICTEITQCFDKNSDLPVGGLAETTEVGVGH